MQDHNIQAGPKMACLEPVAHQQQSLYIIQKDKDNCNCIFFHLFLNRHRCVSLNARSFTHTDYYVERFIIREEHTHTPAVLHRLVIVESQFAHV